MNHLTRNLESSDGTGLRIWNSHDPSDQDICIAWRCFTYRTTKSLWAELIFFQFQYLFILIFKPLFCEMFDLIRFVFCLRFEFVCILLCDLIIEVWQDIPEHHIWLNDFLGWGGRWQMRYELLIVSDCQNAMTSQTIPLKMVRHHQKRSESLDWIDDCVRTCWFPFVFWGRDSTWGWSFFSLLLMMMWLSVIFFFFFSSFASWTT